MTQLQCAAVLTILASKLDAEGSWCGETHVQKAVYFLQRLLGRDLGYHYLLYKHGPFSFELREALTLLRAEHLLDRRSQEPQYGPRLVVTQVAQRLWERYYRTLEAWKEEVSFVAVEIVSDKGVAELERLATALYVLAECKDFKTRESQVRHMTVLKPHIEEQDARGALSDIEEFTTIAKERQLLDVRQ